ncbi:GH3 auxin-responsive promoter [Legionella qingyii]|uniref:GH3 auxin-responsive promoter n=1 Tax=Legionella qingyii TaxID=2184757 RepID=A0A317TZP0_9GAMM|nr:GH3 auxin-responsive promoter family protein [Legionella qingyii]PWY55223.1 GH3 auxin-responsive promoter [Legionella qingyii]RUR25352.1 GH3 auxin-responsive promoter [Legionella qingyii]RUR28537.1 GH3 auxin-responsive promoter [Legionella qingyii]
MNWKRLLIAAITRKKYQAFIEDTKYPQRSREKLWNQEIIPLLKRSSYWSAALKSIHTLNLSDFPITTYEDYEEDLLAAQYSLIQPFNGEKLIFWSETSGTAGVRKFFPITTSFQTQFQRTMPPYIYTLTQHFPGLFQEKILYLAAVDAHRTSPAGVPSGWISNFNYRNLPSFIKRFYALPDELFDNTEVYIQWSALYALASDLSAIFAVTPMVIDALFERCLKNFRHFLPYLLGDKAVPEFLPPIQITRKRREYLRQLAQQEPRSFKEFWPSLSVVGCWISALCEYPAQQLKKLLGSGVDIVDGTFSATEGWLTVPIDNQPGGFLHPGAHITEFIEEGKSIEKENLLQSWELEQGKNYEVFLTTAMGFVRYRLKDVVKCTGFLNKAPRLEFCYKTQMLKLESCSITSQELQEMLHDISFEMESHWYFARNSLGNRIVLVTDDATQIGDPIVTKMHERLMQINEPYAHGVITKEVLPMVLFQLPKDELLEDSHAQTKPKLISQQVITEK